MKSIAIVGASGGIGAALLDCLLEHDDVGEIYATCHRSLTGSSLGNTTGTGLNTRIHWTSLDATDEAAVCSWVADVGKIDWVINCVGMLHNENHGPEKSIRMFDPLHFQHSMMVNCLPTLLLGKYIRPMLKDSPSGVFVTISARVGSITDNRLGGWYSYRASKAALNMALKCLAIEWARNTPNLRVAALHPGTTDTPLSKPFQQNVPQGKLFSPDMTARMLISQIEQLHEQPSGRFIAFDGVEIPW